VQLQPLQDFKGGLIVQKAADEAVDLLAENELTCEKDRVPELLSDLEAEPFQLEHHVGADRGTQLGVESKVGRKPAVFDQIVGDFGLELLDFGGALEQRGIDFPDAYEDHVFELIVEKTRERGQSRETEPVKTIDQQRRR
jgi:hypothetical protein